MTCPHTLDTGSYLLGALDPIDRDAFESHLANCASCADALGELRPLPALLGQLDPQAAAVIGGRDRRWPRTLLALATAACLALVVGFSVHLVDDRRLSPPTPTMAMRPVDPSAPVTAEIGLVAQAGSTRIDMACHYHSGYGGEWAFLLYVYRRDGEYEQVASWTAGPNDDRLVSGVTRFVEESISRVELRRADGTTLLTWGQ